MGRQERDVSAVTDEQIIDLYWRREERAIRETDRKYGRWILGLAERILHDCCDAEECRNDAYLGVWNAIPPTRPRVFQAFLSVVTRNVAMDRYRKNPPADGSRPNLRCP